MQAQEEPTSLTKQQSEEEEEYEESSEDNDIEIDDAFKRNNFEYQK